MLNPAFILFYFILFKQLMFILIFQYLILNLIIDITDITINIGKVTSMPMWPIIL